MHPQKKKDRPLVSNFRMDPLPGRIIVEVNKTLSKFLLMDIYSGNLVPRVFRLFGQRGNAGKTLRHRKNSNFLIGCSVPVSIVLPQKSCGYKIRCPQSLPDVAPLTKKPEDSEYEINILGN